MQTEKLASLGQLTAGIAHEIKNPLNFVNNFSALSAELTDELNDVLKQAALNDKMRGEVDELTGCCRTISKRSCSTASAPTPSSRTCCCIRAKDRASSGPPTSTPWWMKASTSPITARARKRRLQYHAGAPLRCRRRRGRAVPAGNHPRAAQPDLERLLCRDQAEDGKRRAGFEPTLLAATKNLGGTVEIRIRDNGTGIPPEVKEKMFNPFFTTKPAGEGTGLGLSMTHDIIVKQHGGTIEVHTEPGRVHRIHDCPAAHRAAAKIELEDRIEHLIVVVDDEPDVEDMFRQQFRRDLRAGRFTMEFALSAPAALEQMKAIPDPR